MIVLDTNVLSELFVARPAEAVLVWLRAQPSASLFSTSVTQAEILFGLELLPAGKRRTQLEGTVLPILNADFAGKLLPFNSAAAIHFASIVARRRKLGRPIDHADAQIAAISLSHSATLATRNTSDFSGVGLSLFDPWTGVSSD